MKILIGSDHIGYPLKADLISFLGGLGHAVIDVGCRGENDVVDYPDIAVALAERIRSGETDRGVLVCGTGIGMAIAANKVPRIRAACCHDAYSAERARRSNDAQVMTMGALIVTPTLAHEIMDHWLASEFADGKSTRKVEKLIDLDTRFRGSG